MRLKITNGRILAPGADRAERAELLVAAGKIVGIGAGAAPDFAADEEIDAAGRFVLPGLVDLCARMREPGKEHEASMESESRAAAAGGVTALCCPPDTEPAIDAPSIVELIRRRNAKVGRTKIYVLGALTKGLEGKCLANMHALKQAGCAGVSNALAPAGDSEMLRRAMEYAATCEIGVFLYCEDPSLRGNGLVHEGETGTRLGLPSIPETAETVALSRALLLLEQIEGARLHCCRITSARAVAMIAEAKARGLPVTADVAVPHLFLTDAALASFDPDYYLRPPLRGDGDRAALREGLATGVLDCACSDHQPHGREAKSRPLAAAEPGAATLELLLPLMFRLAEEGALDRGRALAAISSRPAEILGIGGGRLEPGNKADICIFDPGAEWTVRAEELQTAGSNALLAGRRLKGRVTHTLLAGKTVYRRDPPETP